MIVDKSRQGFVDMENIKNGYSISRRMASKLLGVSTRTVDRYVKDSKLSTVTIAGRIWLNKREIHDIQFRKRHGVLGSEIKMSTLNMSIDNSVDSTVDSVDNVHTVDRQTINKKEKIEDQKNQLILLSKKIEKIEYKLENSMSITSHKLKILSFEIENRTLEKFLSKTENILDNLSDKYQKTYIKKYIYLVLLLFLLALQPLWILIHFDKFF